MASVFKGMLSLGLVNVPIKLSAAARSERIEFNSLHKDCGTKIKLQRRCPVHGDINWNDVEKGYEVAKNTYLSILPEELKAYEPQSNQTIEITQTVRAGEMDPLLFESSYYLEPEPAGRKGYKLVVQALQLTELYALAKITMTHREHVAVIRPVEGCLTMHTMFYDTEVRSAPTLGLEAIELKDQEVALAQQLLNLSYAEFDHKKFADSYQQSIAELIAVKRDGGKVRQMPTAAKVQDTGDLLGALEASVKIGKGVNDSIPAQPKKRKTA